MAAAGEEEEQATSFELPKCVRCVCVLGCGHVCSSTCAHTWCRLFHVGAWLHRLLPGMLHAAAHVASSAGQACCRASPGSGNHPWQSLVRTSISHFAALALLHTGAALYAGTSGPCLRAPLHTCCPHRASHHTGIHSASRPARAVIACTSLHASIIPCRAVLAPQRASPHNLAPRNTCNHVHARAGTWKRTTRRLSCRPRLTTWAAPSASRGARAATPAR